MNQYYYLVSSLPAVQPDGDISLDLREFLKACETWLSPEEMDTLAQTDTIEIHRLTASKNATISSWASWESGLRNALLKVRASAISKDPSEYIRLDAEMREHTEIAGIPETVRNIAGADDPMQAETIAYYARWRFLDLLETGHIFDVDRVILYYLKLKLRTRRSRMTAVQGRAAFEAHYKTVAETFPLNLEE